MFASAASKLAAAKSLLANLNLSTSAVTVLLTTNAVEPLKVATAFDVVENSELNGTLLSLVLSPCKLKVTNVDKVTLALRSTTP